MVSWMEDLACSRNVGLRACSDDVADLASRFYTPFITCRFYDFMRMFLIFFGCHCAQIGVTSNGCLDEN